MGDSLAQGISMIIVYYHADQKKSRAQGQATASLASTTLDAGLVETVVRSASAVEPGMSLQKSMSVASTGAVDTVSLKSSAAEVGTSSQELGSCDSGQEEVSDSEGKAWLAMLQCIWIAFTHPADTSTDSDSTSFFQESDADSLSDAGKE